MRTIKRYPNRKLYDTRAKKYITLDEIADLIRSGLEIQVIDNASGDDLTAVTLTQIIFEQEKQKGFLPRALLASLIQTGGDRLNALQRSLQSPGSFLRHVDEEIRFRINELVRQGELLESEGMNLADKLLRPSRSAFKSDSGLDEAQIESILANHNLPSRQEFDRIIDQLEVLESKLDELSHTDS